LTFIFIYLRKNSQLKEEALQRELHFMRLALLKNNSCQCNSLKDKAAASNQSDDQVREVAARFVAKT
jgi:hypothetical protein